MMKSHPRFLKDGQEIYFLDRKDSHRKPTPTSKNLLRCVTFRLFMGLFPVRFSCFMLGLNQAKHAPCLPTLPRSHTQQELFFYITSSRQLNKIQTYRTTGTNSMFSPCISGVNDSVKNQIDLSPFCSQEGGSQMNLRTF